MHGLPRWLTCHIGVRLMYAKDPHSVSCHLLMCLLGPACHIHAMAWHDM